MGLHVERLRNIGDTAIEGKIVKWCVNLADKIKKGQTLVEVETDKSVVEIPASATGIVRAIHCQVDDIVLVNSVLAEIEVEGTEDEPATPKFDTGPTATASRDATLIDVPPASQQQFSDARPTKSAIAADSRSPGAAPLASPAVRRRARDLGIDLQLVPATGADGRITSDDLDKHVKSGSAQSTLGPITDTPQPPTDIVKTELTQIRRTIAKRMLEAKQRIPHFTYVEECDLTDLEALRLELNASKREEQPHLTLLPFLMRALVRSVPELPSINAHYDDQTGFLSTHKAIHIGIATQTSRGLFVPVVHHAEARDIWGCATELKRVTEAVRERTATHDDLSGSTITLTSLGPLGGIAATPIINLPEVAILAPNKIVERPVVYHGNISVRKMMNLSSSFDHRIIDGHDAARFIQVLRRFLESPAQLVMP